MNPRGIIGYILMSPIIIYALLHCSVTYLCGFRWGDNGWCFKWYKKTKHGKELEKKIGYELKLWRMFR
jgi:hypothetical protein